MSRVFEAWQRATLAAREAAGPQVTESSGHPSVDEVADDLPPEGDASPLTPAPLPASANRVERASAHSFRAGEAGAWRRVGHREQRTFAELIRDIARDEQELG
jgi:hypothetical protein